MDDNQTPPLGTAIGFGVATALLWLAVHLLWPAHPLELLIIGCVWPIVALAALYWNARRELLWISRERREPRNAGLGTIGYLVIVLGPIGLEALELIGRQTNPADFWTAAGLLVARAAICLALLWSLIVVLPRLRGDWPMSLSARFMPSVLILSLIILLGSTEQFGFLSWAVSAAVFQWNFTLRVSLLLGLAGLVAIVLLLVLIDTVFRAYRSGLGLKDKWADLMAVFANRESEGLIDQLLGIAQAMGLFFQICGHFLQRFGVTMVETVKAIVEEYRTFPVVFRVLLTPLIAVGVLLEGFAPDMMLTLGLPAAAPFDTWSMLYGVLLFGWIGAVTITGCNLVWTGLGSTLRIYGVHAMFAVFGIWVCLVVALGINLSTGHAVLRQTLPGSLFLITFAGVWLTFWAFASLDGQRRVISYGVIAIATIGWIAFNIGYYWNNAASLKQLGWDPFAQFIPPPGPPQAVAPPPPPETPPSPPSAGHAAEAPGPRWLAGLWGLDPQCRLTIRIVRVPDALRITFRGRTELQRITSETATMVSTAAWRFTNESGRVSAVSQGVDLGVLQPCAS